MVGLKDKYKDYFKIGAAVNVNTIVSHADLIKEHFNSITCENETKFINLQGEKGKFNFSPADKIVQFGRVNNLAMRGHVFAWHNQSPDWLFENTNREEMLERTREHIRIVGQRYNKDFYCWDAVNEAIEDKTDSFYRQSPWVRIIGEDFADYVFRYAKEILPDTDLYYNDYNESIPTKRDKIYEYVKGMLDRGVPVDGIGMQCHWSIYYPSTDLIKQAIEKYAGLGLKIQITEMDISMFAHDDNSVYKKPTEQMIELQANAYQEVFAIFREYKDIIDNVTLWGVADDCTWLDYFPVFNRKNWPLLFDENHQPKEALLRIMDF
jgi:endo-1,4-beta-xylanase